MSELLSNLWMVFQVAANPFNILFCLLGALVGTLVGVLPGIGTVATIAMLLPITFGLPPVGALIMLAGIYYGAQYGGSTTSVLVNIPGEATSVIRWHAKAGPGPRFPLLPSAPFSPAAYPRCWSRRSAHHLPASPCCSVRPSISRSWC